jgi:hypothetical protein
LASAPKISSTSIVRLLSEMTVLMVVVQFGWKNCLFIFEETVKYKDFHAVYANFEKQS